jgi:hypothetical protein
MDNIEKDIEKIRQIISEESQKYAALGGEIQFIDIKDRSVRIRPAGICWR